MLHYTRSEANLYFWRTNHGAEVDLVIERHGKLRAAFEIKAGAQITGAHLSGLRSFKEEYPQTNRYIISTVPEPYEIEGVGILPWKKYLIDLKQWIKN